MLFHKINILIPLCFVVLLITAPAKTSLRAPTTDASLTSPLALITAATAAAVGGAYVHRTRELSKRSKLLITPKVDKFNETKAKFKDSIPHVPYWHLYYMNPAQRINHTNCALFAEYYITLQTGIQDPGKYLNLNAVGCCECSPECKKKIANLERSYHVPLTPLNTTTETFCYFDDFIQKNSRMYQNHLAQELFNYSQKAESVSFYIALHHGAHVFVIEKISDGVQTWWRLFNSWEQTFTANQWLGNDDWRNNDARYFDAFFKKYGGDTILGSKDVLNIFNEFVHILLAHPSNVSFNKASLPIYVKLFKTV